MPGQEQHPKLPNSYYLNKIFQSVLGIWHTYDSCDCTKLKHKTLEWQEGLQEDWKLMAAPWGHASVVGMAPMLIEGAHARPAANSKSEGNTDARGCWMKHGMRKSCRCSGSGHLTQALWCQTSRHLCVLASPHMHSMCMCFGSSRKRSLFCSIHILFFFFFFQQ